MRIGVIGRQKADSFADNICDSLTAMGIDSVRLGPARIHPKHVTLAMATSLAQDSATIDNRLQGRIASRALSRECTAVITVDADTSPSMVRRLRSNGVPVALWSPAGLGTLGRFQMLLAPYSGLFLKEPLLVKRLKAMLDLPVHDLPEACNARWDISTEVQGTDPVIVVPGSMYPSRYRLIERLAGAGIPIRVVGGPRPKRREKGGPPEHARKHLPVRREKADIFRRTAAVLNNRRPGEVEGVNHGLFEATGSGAVVLTERRSDVERLFAPGETVLWSSFDELVDQARHAIQGAGSLSSIGDRAAIRAHADHTYEKRLPRVLDVLA